MKKRLQRMISLALMVMLVLSLPLSVSAQSPAPFGETAAYALPDSSLPGEAIDDSSMPEDSVPPSDSLPSEDGDSSVPQPDEDLPAPEDGEPAPEDAGTEPDPADEPQETPEPLPEAMVAAKGHLAEKLSGFAELVPDVDYVEHELVFIAETEAEVQAVAAAYGAEVVSNDEGVVVIRTRQTAMDVLQMASDVTNQLPPVYPNMIYTTMPVDNPYAGEMTQAKSDDVYAAGYNDPFLNPADSSYQWFHNLIDSQFAWAAGKTGAGVKVAVLDTGISTTHPDFAGQYTDAESKVPGETVEDGNGHGSNVAGIIAALGNNGVQGTGVAPGAKIVPVKVLDDAKGSGSTAQIVQGIRYAMGVAGVKVINMSLGGIGYDIIYEQAITDAVNAGVLVVVAAGNDSISKKVYPAACADAFTVSAVGAQKQLSSFSNYGSYIDIAAPGGDQIIDANYDPDYFGYVEPIYSCGTGTSVSEMEGTSQAAPMVSAVAALVYSANPGLMSAATRESVLSVQNILKSTATKNGDKSKFGAGLVNAANAVGAGNVVPVPVPSVASGGKVVPGTALKLNATNGDTVIYYTTDGKAPSDGSTLYTDAGIPLSGKGKVTVKAIAYLYGKKSAVGSFTYTYDDARVTALAVNGKTGYLGVAAGSKLNMEAVVTPSFAKNSSVSWKVDDTAKASITPKGVLTAQASATGSVQVTATANDGSGVSATVTVTIYSPTTEVTLADSQKTIELVNDGGAQSTVLLTPTATAAAGTPQNAFNYKSSKPKVAVVDPVTGLVTATGSGTAKITVTAADGTGKSTSCTVKVTTPIRAIALSTTNVNGAKLATGKTLTLKPIFNGGAEKPDNVKLDWSSSNSSVASVSGKGVVKGTGQGTAVITAKSQQDGTVKGEFTVTVYPVTTRIDLKMKKATGSMGTGYFLSDFVSSVSPSVTMDVYSYSTSNKKVIDIDKSSGDFIAVNPGTATLTIKAMDGSNKKASVKVTVMNSAIEGVAIRSATGVLEVASGKSLQLDSIALPKTASQKVSYYFLDGSYLKNKLAGYSLSGSGKLTAKKGLTTPENVTVLVLFNPEKKGNVISAEVAVPVTVRVFPATTKVNFSAPSSMSVGMTAATTTTCAPDNAQGKFKYTSSDYKVATVDSNGNIKAVGKGKVTITATAIDGTGMKASQAINVS
ncbi:S8 family serine peptidase [Ruminococcaceae bacterium OttesenSCG-928-D13]|nr:S8 family serine peptidase [Ruminococcaceae bacterium OttesenSCG-928-D13]